MNTVIIVTKWTFENVCRITYTLALPPTHYRSVSSSAPTFSSGVKITKPDFTLRTPSAPTSGNFQKFNSLFNITNSYSIFRIYFQTTYFSIFSVSRLLNITNLTALNSYKSRVCLTYSSFTHLDSRRTIRIRW